MSSMLRSGPRLICRRFPRPQPVRTYASRNGTSAEQDKKKRGVGLRKAVEDEAAAEEHAFHASQFANPFSSEPRPPPPGPPPPPLGKPKQKQETLGLTPKSYGWNQNKLSPVTLSGLVSKCKTNIGPLLLERSASQSDDAPRLDSDQFPYPIHPSTLSQLRSTVSAVLRPGVHVDDNPVRALPAFREGIITLACPLKGSELYLKEMARSVAVENDADFMHIQTSEIMGELSAAEVVDNPPIESYRNPEGFITTKTVGRKRTMINPSSGAMVILNAGGPGGLMNEDDGDSNEDVPFVPYPWFRGYQGNNKERMIIPFGRVDAVEPYDEVQLLITDAWTRFFDRLWGARRGSSRPLILYYEDLADLISSDESKSTLMMGAFCKSLKAFRMTGENGSNIVVITPYTTTFGKLVSTEGHGGGGLGGFIRALNAKASEADDDEPGPPRGGGAGGLDIFGGQREAPQGMSYSHPLAKYVGVSSVNVFPPSGVQKAELQKLLDADLRTIHLEANLRNLENVANYVHIPITVRKELDKAGRLESRASRVSRSESKKKKSLAQQVSADKYPLGALTSRPLTWMEIETILLHSVTAQRQRTSKANTNDITSQDLQFGSDLFEANQLAVLDANHGAAHSGIFRNPSDRATLTKREQTLLNQCLLKPDPATGSFNRVGGLAETKRTIEELISLPLTRPELFRTGILSQSTTGILLFGPPGTGKTLLARAVAAESGANFLNVQMSDISSMWVGENEKNVKSLFSLARKLAPTVIFVDEIDALLRARQRNAAQHMTNTINEFMQEWDGISSGGDASKAVIVVGATNRPFDLDEAVLRRLPRRILVPLPNAQARKEILTICLKDDEVVDREKLAETVAEWTEGWSGSDLRNFCIAAAYTAIRKSTADAATATATKPAIDLSHFKQALDSGDVRPSLTKRAELSQQIQDWDKLYGTGAGGMRGIIGDWGF